MWNLSWANCSDLCFGPLLRLVFCKWCIAKIVPPGWPLKSLAISFFRGSLYYLQILNSLREILRRRWRSTKTWRWKWILGDLMLGINAGLLVDQYQLRDGFIYWVYDGYLLNHLPQLVDIASMPILGIWLVSIPKKKTSTSIGIDTRHMLFNIKSTWFQVCNTNHLGIPD